MAQTNINMKSRAHHRPHLTDGCLIYTRVSTDRQAEEGYSLREQETSCRKLAARKGYEVLMVYREEGASGTTSNRPKFKEMLGRCSEDRCVKAVIVIHTDRFARNTLEHLTVKTLLKKYNVELLSVLQPMLDDSPEGNLMDIVLAGVNEFYSRDLGRKTSKGLRQKAEEGWWPGPAPLGYLNRTDPKTRLNVVIVDKDRGHYVSKAFKRFATGDYTVESLAEELCAEGFRTKLGYKPSKSVMTSLLHNIFYTGKMRYKGRVLRGNHQPLTNMKTYSKVQGILNLHNRGANRSRKHRFLLSGFLFCSSCGNQMTGERHIKKSGLVFDYYRCVGTRNKSKVCRYPFVRATRVEQDLACHMKRICLTERFLNTLRRSLEEVAYSQKQVDTARAKSLRNRRIGIQRKMDRLENLMLSGVMDEKRATRKYLQLKEEMERVEGEISAGKNPTARLTQTDIEAIIQFVQSVYDTYRSFDRLNRRRFLEGIISKIWIGDQRIKAIDYTPAFQMIVERDLVRVRTEHLRVRDLIRTLAREKVGKSELDFAF